MLSYETFETLRAEVSMPTIIQKHLLKFTIACEDRTEALKEMSYYQKRLAESLVDFSRISSSFEHSVVESNITQLSKIGTSIVAAEKKMANEADFIRELLTDYEVAAFERILSHLTF